MNKSKPELKVGVFIFVAMIILAIFIFKIGNLKQYGSGYQMRFLFGNVSGVKSGSPVRFAGVDVGEVRRVNILKNSPGSGVQIEVITWIKKSLLIPRDSSAYVSTLGLLGEKYIEVIPPAEIKSFLGPDDALRGTDPVMMQYWVDKAGKMINELQELIQKLKSDEGTIGKLLYDDKLYQELEALITDIRRHPWKLFWKTKEK